MRYLTVVVAYAVLSSATAWAAGYDDYMRGYEARRVGNVDLALTAFTAALSAGNLAPSYIPDAHIGRADALMRKGRCAEAITDLDAALTSRPGNIEALKMRAHVNNCVGKKGAAIADVDAVVAAAPSTDSYTFRGGFHWYAGNFTAAAGDYLKAAAAQPKRTYAPEKGAYALLWYAISSARSKNYDADIFAKQAETLDIDVWPAPLLDYVLGKVKADAVYREAAKGEGNNSINRRCDADFFIGEWLVGNGDVSGKALLESLGQTCPKGAAILRDAHHDLSRLP